jgi:hypothetical protein
VQVLAGIQYCSSNCRFFRCGKNALLFRGDSVWCRWTEEACEVANCSYVTCIKRRLLPQGVCGETVKRKTIETEPERTVMPTVRLKGKALRKLGEKEIF